MGTSIRSRQQSAFTLVELLVVIGIIALLISILLPALSRAREAGYKAKCLSNLHQVGLAMMEYRLDNRDYFYEFTQTNGTVNYNWYNNGGQWDNPAPNRTLLPPTPNPATTIPSGSTAVFCTTYWAVAYMPYIVHGYASYTGTDAESRFATARSLWRCPSSVWTSPIQEADSSVPDTDTTEPSSIGLNWFVIGRQAGMFRNPSQLIVCQDSPEQTMEGNGDMLTCYQSTNSGTNVQNLNSIIWKNAGQNLLQWTNTSNAYYFKNALHEYYRHNNSCNCLRLDGHADSVPYSANRGANIPYSWYSGQFGSVSP